MKKIINIPALASLLFGLYLLFYILPLGLRPMLIPDEARYAEIPREMIAGDNWLSPRFDGMKYFEKPSGGYWPTIIAQKLFGENNFSTRLPGALAAGFTLLLVLLLASKCLPAASGEGGAETSRYFPLLAAFILMATGEFYIISTVAVLDGVFSLFVCGTMVFFYLGWLCKDSFAKRHSFLLAAGLSAGAAFMVKGLLAFALPGLAILAFLIWRRDWKSMWRLPWTPLIGAVMICAPWAYMTHLREPGFWEYFIMVEHVQRFFGKVAEQHPEPIVYFMYVFPLGLLPFTIFLPSLWFGAKKLDWRNDSLLIFCSAWIVMPFILLSLSSGKLATYIMPLFPPAAMIIACSVFAARDDKRASVFFNWTALITSVAAVVCAVVFVILQAVQAKGAAVYTKETLYLAALAGFFVLAFAFILAASVRMNGLLAKYALLIVAVFALMPVWFLCFPTRIAADKAPEKFFTETAARVPSDAVVMAHKDYIGISTWSLKRTDIAIFAKEGEFEYCIRHSEDPDRMFYNVERFIEFVKNRPSDGKKIALYLHKRHVKRYFKDILVPAEQYTNGEVCLLIF